MSKKIEKICRNCKLYNGKKGECAIVVLHEGERHHLPVLAEDPCFFEGQYFDPTTNTKEDFVDEIKEVKFWVENEKGEKIDGNGIVKIEYPKGFFAPIIDKVLHTFK